MLCLLLSILTILKGDLLQYGLLYFAAVSLLAVGVTVFDKLSAKEGGRRVPEHTLMVIAAIGGALFMYATMRIIRHKTRHILFMAGIPLIMAVQAIIAVLLYAVQ